MESVWGQEYVIEQAKKNSLTEPVKDKKQPK
jgi:hypothetical protein